MPSIENREEWTPLKNGRFHNCFGCSPGNDSGMRMAFHIDEKRDSVMSWYSVPHHLCGWGEMVHGGIVSTMLDEAMGWACISILGRLPLSKSIEVAFFGPLWVGKEIRVKGQVQVINSDREAVMQGFIYDDREELCAESSSVVSLLTLEAIRKMGVMDEKILDELEQAMHTGL
jgi:acyl-coenzyme A thioesterase PaaI-like protein